MCLMCTKDFVSSETLLYQQNEDLKTSYLDKDLKTSDYWEVVETHTQSSCWFENIQIDT